MRGTQVQKKKVLILTGVYHVDSQEDKSYSKIVTLILFDA